MTDAGAEAINPWTCTKEEEAAWKQYLGEKRKKIMGSPKFQHGQKRSDTLMDILLFSMRLPELVASANDIKRLQTPELLEYLSPHNLPELRAIFNYMVQEEKERETLRSFQWLRLQMSSYHMNKRKEESKPDTLNPRYWRQCTETLDDFRIAFRIGSALAICEQMDRSGLSEPSFSKAQWLLSEAPDAEGIPRRGVGSPEEIARAWKYYYSVSHLWAAYVAMTGEPFIFDPAKLIRFFCEASLGRFRRLAATYFQFRRDVVAPRSGRTVAYIKQGLDSGTNMRDIADTRPIARELLPNLLNEKQWGALDYYRAPVRKTRA